MNRQRNFKAIRSFFLWTAIIFLSISGVIMAAQPKAPEISDKKEHTMSLVSEQTTEPLSIPALDEMVPPNLETASFGLG